jgi:hypothetical protein
MIEPEASRLPGSGKLFMMSVGSIDPHKLSPSELLNEWSIREEELRIQNEQLRESEKHIGEIANRFERIFHYLPLPVLLLDHKAFVQDVNKAAIEILPMVSRMKNFYLPRALTDRSKRILIDHFQTGAPEAVTRRQLEFLESSSPCEATLIKMSNEQESDCALVLNWSHQVSHPSG